MGTCLLRLLNKSPSWGTVYDQLPNRRNHSILFMFKRNNDECTTDIRQKKRAPQQRGEHKKKLVSSDESAQACGRCTCCSELWWIPCCHCSSPKGKYNYKSLISSLECPRDPALVWIYHMLITAGRCCCPCCSALSTSPPPSFTSCNIKDSDCWNSFIICEAEYPIKKALEW